MEKDPNDKILCAIVPHPDVMKGVVQTLEDEDDWSQFKADLKEDMAITEKPITVKFQKFTRRYFDSLEELS